MLLQLFALRRETARREVMCCTLQSQMYECQATPDVINLINKGDVVTCQQCLSMLNGFKLPQLQHQV